MHLVQLRRPTGERAGAIVEGDRLRLVAGLATTHGLAETAIVRGTTLEAVVSDGLGAETEDYDAVIAEGRLLPPLDHLDPAPLLVTGTGLTHLGSAATRDSMHSMKPEEMTDSMKMFRMGLEGGKPSAGEVGVQPEWFYKGDGSTVVAPGAELSMPGFAQDGGEEPEGAGLYVVGPDGMPYRLGFALGNEFSDHVTERHNYLWLAHSKLRACSVGPELRVGDLPEHVAGDSRLIRGGKTIWQKPFLSGEKNMSHTFANLEYHHFKYTQFRRPGDVHIHFFGAATLSFADGIRTEPGDTFEIEMKEFGAPLRNTLAAKSAESFAYGGVAVL